VNPELRERLMAHCGPFGDEALVPVAGGSINRSFCLTDHDGRRWFLKLNDAQRADVLTSEADGLKALATAGSVRVPALVDCGLAGDQAWLLMEYLDLTRGDAAAAEALGRGLARQHRNTAERFGWHCDNVIGATPQPNGWRMEWLVFLRDQRLEHQFRLAADQGYRELATGPGQALLDALPRLLGAHRPPPSLLHGDLWGGNWGALADGSPVIFDPAVYFGDREADLAMTRLFGGFPAGFYQAYEAEWPLPAGHEIRCELYKLYHLLNHLNLFGAAYAGQVDHCLATLLRQFA
jgi:protein-ribulosamine 3-kinase